jgi:hypothetical protein
MPNLPFEDRVLAAVAALHCHVGEGPSFVSPLVLWRVADEWALPGDEHDWCRVHDQLLALAVA